MYWKYVVESILKRFPEIICFIKSQYVLAQNSVVKLLVRPLIHWNKCVTKSRYFDTKFNCTKMYNILLYFRETKRNEYECTYLRKCVCMYTCTCSIGQRVNLCINSRFISKTKLFKKVIQMIIHKELFSSLCIYI